MPARLSILLLVLLGGCALKTAGDGERTWYAIAPDWFTELRCELRRGHEGPHLARLTTRFSGVNLLVQWENGQPTPDAFTVEPAGAWRPWASPLGEHGSP